MGFLESVQKDTKQRFWQALCAIRWQISMCRLLTLNDKNNMNIYHQRNNACWRASIGKQRPCICNARQKHCDLQSIKSTYSGTQTWTCPSPRIDSTHLETHLHSSGCCVIQVDKLTPAKGFRDRTTRHTHTSHTRTSTHTHTTHTHLYIPHPDRSDHCTF